MVVEMNVVKNKKGSKRMAGPKSLIHDYPIISNKKYLNISTGYDRSHAGMEEWLSRSLDTRWPFGLVGSIPVAGVTNYSNLEVLR